MCSSTLSNPLNIRRAFALSSIGTELLRAADQDPADIESVFRVSGMQSRCIFPPRFTGITQIDNEVPSGCLDIRAMLFSRVVDINNDSTNVSISSGKGPLPE